MSEQNTARVRGQTERSEETTQQKSEECDPEHPQQQPETDGESNQDFHSRPFVTPGSEIPENLLHLSHSFGYDSRRRSNLRLLDDTTLLFIAGNTLVLLDIPTGEQRYLRSCSGGGIGAIMVHPSGGYFVVAEKGNQPNIIVYEYPSLTPYRVLKGGTEQEYSFVDFNCDGSQLASVGSAPDYTLTLWDWRRQEVMQSCKATSQDVYRVSFSPHNPGLLTSSGSGHIKFWRMATTFTGLKLQGVMGHFGNTAASEIEGYVELPDGKVLSGTEWGNLLLWSGNAIKAEICRKEGRSCHLGTVQPFALEDGQLLTFGSDGVVRGWDFERINAAGSSGDSGTFEMEPINEMVVGHNVCLSSMVRSNVPDSFVWFAQDSNGAIWKLDLSFTNTSPDPECLFAFHAGVIQGLDVSKKSHLMATTTLDRSVKVFDFLAKKELTTSRFNQGGTVLSWAPPSVNHDGGLLVTGFEDGVVRLLELYNPQRLHAASWRSAVGDAKLRLKQAFKPHNAPVTAMAYDGRGQLLATGSTDCTVFFFTVAEKYRPIGFIRVPGPVQALEWSPQHHSDSRLLILCQNGHVIEVHGPDPEAQKPPKTFELDELPRRSFRFRSIKSRIKREEEIARRQKEKEKKERETQADQSSIIHLSGEQKKEDKDEEEELPPIYIPDPPSPLYCGFYSQPGQFWLSVGGFDAGYLYHCKFSENQDEDSDQRQDEPFDLLPLHDADEDPVRSVTFSSSRQLLLCGMHSGSIRVYTLQPDDHSLSSMTAYWALNVHDNHYGHVRHVRCSHDDLFVVTAGDDGNVFSFSLRPPEDLQKSLQKTRAKVPSPRVGLESEALAPDIEDPAAYSIETAKQRLEKDQLRREAELKAAERQKALAELQKRFRQVLIDNQSLPEHVRLKPEELQLDQRFYEQAEKLKAQQMMEVRRQLAWEEERCSIAVRKLQDWFRDSLEANIVTVVAMRSDHRVTSYRLPSFLKPAAETKDQSAPSQPDRDEDAGQQCKKSRAEPKKTSSKTEVKGELRPPVARPAKIKLGDRQEERLRKAAEKAELARAKIEKRKQEWAQIYAEKPKEDYEDPQDVQAIKEAWENIGDYAVTKHQRMNAERKKEELVALENNMREKQVEMNRLIVMLRDTKVHLVSQLQAQAQQLQRVQQCLAPDLHRPAPSLPVLHPEETPEKWLQYSDATLERYRTLREQRLRTLESEEQEEEEGAASLLEQLEKEMKAKEEEERGSAWTATTSASSIPTEKEETAPDGGAEGLEEEVQKEEEIRLLYKQNSLLEQMESLVSQFDRDLLLLRSQKLRLDYQLKLADFRLLTLFQEMLLLKTFERKEDSLQEKLNTCIEEERSVTLKLEESTEQLELKKRDIANLQQQEKSLSATFQESVGENNSFTEFLTKVFKKKIKQVKKKEQTGDEEKEEDSDEDSDDEEWDDDYNSDTDAALDDSVCPRGCDPELFENTLKLRELRTDLEEIMTEEKKIAEALKRELDALSKKDKMVKTNRKAIEEDLEIINKEKQQKMNELDVVVALRLHQIEFVTDGSMPSDLSVAMVLTDSELKRLQERIQQLQEEKLLEGERLRQARQQHTKLINDRSDMAARIQVLEKQCSELMMMKFGKLVDLTALQTLSGNRRLEELKHEKLLKEAANAKELRQWDAKVEEAQQALMEVTRRNTDHLRSMTSMLDHKKELELRLGTRQRKMGKLQFQDCRRRVDQEEIQKLQELVRMQSQQAEALRREIYLLCHKGGRVRPPDLARLHLHPHPPLPSPIGHLHIGKS